jgi:hypothetical protein
MIALDSIVTTTLVSFHGSLLGLVSGRILCSIPVTDFLLALGLLDALGLSRELLAIAVAVGGGTMVLRVGTHLSIDGLSIAKNHGRNEGNTGNAW